ncbi:hypothetical protein CC79DRAFT_1329607 [Sarocladium strictum]
MSSSLGIEAPLLGCVRLPLLACPSVHQLQFCRDAPLSEVTSRGPGNAEQHDRREEFFCRPGLAYWNGCFRAA